MNILIIKLGALGDVVMATPLIAAIQRRHPHARIDLITAASYADLFANWPNLHVERRPRRGVLNTLHTVRWIRQHHYARIYDLQSNDRSALWCALSGAKERVGNHCRYPYTHHPRERWRGQGHIFKRMAQVLASAGIDDVGDRPILPVDAVARDRVRAWIDHHVGATAYCVLHPHASATRPEKKWPYFDRLARRLIQHGLCPVWLGSASDSAANREFIAAAGGCDASAQFSIPALAELGRGAKFAVTNDSGPMHALAAAAIPVFGIFGPSDWRRNHALGQRDHVIAGVDLVAGYEGRRAAACLAELEPDAVWHCLQRAGVV